MPALPRIAALLFCVLLAACAGVSTRPSAIASPTPGAVVLLVSVDGLRAQDAGGADMPNLARMAAEGVRAEGMRPSYPSLTFPNHYTLVTGMRPGRHGVVHNTMRVASLGNFRTKDRQAVGDGRWWSGARPIWISAEKAGLRTATMFWPGSEAEIEGMRPSQWRLYDGNVTASERVRQALSWLGLPDAQRPALVTLYFDMVDHASHDHGPGSPQAREARALVDGALGELQAGLAQRGLDDAVNIVLVSDHGFADAPPEHYIAIEDMAPAEVADNITAGQVVGFAPRPGYTVQAERALLGRHDRYECWRRHKMPAQWHYGRNARVPPIVCQMDEGWNAIKRDYLEKARPEQLDHGSHGYDPALPSMRATFIASGPAFRHGVRLPVFDNVDVYPLLARLLGIKPEPNDGDIAPLLPALRDAP